MNRYPKRNQISKRIPMPVWRVPLTGFVTPRLQTQKPSGPIADAIGFQRLEEGDSFAGTWVRKKDQSK